MPIKTYDPTSMLEGNDITAMLSGPEGSRGHMFVTTLAASPSQFLLSLDPVDGQAGVFEAGLGKGGSLSLVGQCFGPVAPMNEALFMQESMKERK